MLQFMRLRAVHLENNVCPVKGWVTLEVEENEEQLLLGVQQASFPSSTHRSLTRLSLARLFIHRTKGRQQCIKRFAIQFSQCPQ